MPNRVPAIFVAIRFDFLLSSLSLCLRFGSLKQSPSTSDFIDFAIACRGGFAGARRSTHYRNSMRCRWQVIRLHQNKISRAAADNGSTPNRIAELNAAAPRAGSAIGKRRNSSSCSPAMENLSLGGSKGGYSLSRKRVSPFKSPERKVYIASEQLEELQCLPIALPITRRCRVWS